MKPELQVWKLGSQSGPLKLELLKLPPGAATLDAASRLLPGGAYTTLRTYAGRKALHFRDHVQRLEETARLAGQPQRLDEDHLRQALRRLLADWPADQEARLRLTLDLEQTPGEIYISLEPLVTPLPQAYQQGVRVVTTHLQRQLPKAKLTRFIDRSAPLRRALPSEVNEAIMLDAEGRLLEGLSSNFFAVLEGVLWTAEQEVLSGITRALALECARGAGLPLRLEAPHLEDLPRFQEAFITSASRGVLPVRQVDQTVIGVACPGPLTFRLMEDFSASLQVQTEPI